MTHPNATRAPRMIDEFKKVSLANVAELLTV